MGELQRTDHLSGGYGSGSGYCQAVPAFRDKIINIIVSQFVIIMQCYLPKKFCELRSVRGIFNDSELDVLAEVLPELAILILLIFLLSILLLVLGFLLLRLVSGLFVVLIVLIVVFLVLLSEGLDHLDCLPDELLAHDLDHLELLELLAGDVQGQVVAVDHTLDEVEVAGHQLLEFLGDEDAAHVELEG